MSCENDYIPGEDVTHMVEGRGIDLDELERRARAAQQGEWRCWGDGFVGAQQDGSPLVFHIAEMTGDRFWNPRNAAYIAAANPQVILALIARIRELEAKQ